MTRSQIQLPGLDVGIPFFLPSWVVLPLALCFGGGPKASQQQKAPPAPPPAPPKASEATAATRYLIRDIASQRSRSTTVLTRERDKLIPGTNGANTAPPAGAPPSSGGPTPSPTGGYWTGPNDWFDNFVPENPLSPTFGGQSPFFPAPPDVGNHVEKLIPLIRYAH